MTSNPKENIMNRSELNSGVPRIKTPLDRRPNDIRHDVIQGRRLIIRVDRMLTLEEKNLAKRMEENDKKNLIGALTDWIERESV